MKIDLPARPRRFVRSAAFALAVAAAGGVYLAATAWLLDRFAPGFPVGDLARDLASTGNVHPLTGAGSQLGLALWAAAAAIAGYNALRHQRAGGRPAVVGFLAATCALSVALLLDDMFMIHEKLGYQTVGLGERSVLGLLVLAAAAVFVTFRRLITSNASLPLLMTSCACFAVMLGVDRVQERFADENLRYLLEDGMKFLGILAWLAWIASTCLHLDEPTDNADPR